jgi:hypothetical protein
MISQMRRAARSLKVKGMSCAREASTMKKPSFVRAAIAS